MFLLAVIPHIDPCEEQLTTVWTLREMRGTGLRKVFAEAFPDHVIVPFPSVRIKQNSASGIEQG